MWDSAWIVPHEQPLKLRQGVRVGPDQHRGGVKLRICFLTKALGRVPRATAKDGEGAAWLGEGAPRLGEGAPQVRDKASGADRYLPPAVSDQGRCCYLY